MNELVAAIDQGTTSTRCLIFAPGARVLGKAQREHRQIYPRPGWVEHDPREIWEATREVIEGALADSGRAGSELAAVGITNQRETTVFWDRRTGATFGNAIVWQDTRTKELCDRLAREGGADRFRARTGLPLSTYFSGPKIAWALEHVPGLRAAAEAGRALCGTIDAWLVWQLTGGPDGGEHVSDVTNASRTQLVELATLAWDEQILAELAIPRAMLPRIAPSAEAEAFGRTRAGGPFGAEIPVCAAIGDQQAALLGQGCFEPGEAKNTYGTGCFLLLNTGELPIASRSGLLTTVAYQLGAERAVYALEGSVAIAGAIVQWLRDNLGLIESSAQVEELAASVEDSGGVYFVPAFSGLFAPRWRADARGVICGLTRQSSKGHLARAALEAVCYQVREVFEAMRADSGVELSELRVDGGMVVNDALMQFQADLLGVPVARPAFVETTVLGAAFAAGLAIGLYRDLGELRATWRAERRFEPALASARRDELVRGWEKAVERSLGWVE